MLNVNEQIFTLMNAGANSFNAIAYPVLTSDHVLYFEFFYNERQTITIFGHYTKNCNVTDESIFIDKSDRTTFYILPVGIQ